MMDAGLLAALGAAMKARAVGVAADRVVAAARVALVKLEGFLPKGDDEKAEALLTHVLGEAAVYPPEKAIWVEPLATAGIVGIWPPHNRLRVNLLWVNFADFPILVSDVQLEARLGGPHDHWADRQRDEFTLNSRSRQERQLELAPLAALPPIERGGAQCDLTVRAVLSGPWVDGRAQLTHDLVGGGMWMPTHGAEPTKLLSDQTDVDIVLEDQLKILAAAKSWQTAVDFAELDRLLKLRPGAAKERLPIVAAKHQHKLTVGETKGQLTLHRPVPVASGYLFRTNRW